MAVNYLKNVLKSSVYASVDVFKELSPNATEFTSTNKEFATAAYSVIKNPTVAFKQATEAIYNSKIYQALDYGAKNLTEDLRTGNFYNKARKERDELKLSGLGGDWDDLSDYGIDDDWEKNLNSDDTEITAGDKKIVQAVEGTSVASSQATVNAVIMASNNQIKANRTDTSILFIQNERLFGGLHNDMTVLGNTLQEMYKMQSASLQNIDKNLSEFFTQESKLSTERNNILREMLELQKKAYTPSNQKELENNKKRNVVRWNNINSDGMVDMSSYFDAVKKNISKQISSMGVSGFGEDSNMLATFMVSPLEGVMKYAINGLIPATVKAAVKEFDDTLSGVFGNFIAELGNARASNKSGVLGMIANILGINTSVNRSIDTSRYEKGPVPFDGITRRAIIDVIPTHLRRIEAALTGRQEETFDYHNGKWVKMQSVKKSYEDIKKNAVSSGTAEIRQAMSKGLAESKKALDITQQAELDQAMEQFYQYLYDHNGRFNPNASPEKNGIGYNYPKLLAHYDQIRIMYKRFDLGVKGNRQRNLKNSLRMRLPGMIMSAKDREEAQYREIETDPANIIARYLSSPKVDEHGRYTGKNNSTFKAYSNLLNTKDSHNNTVYDYLYNINKELTWMRLNYEGIGSGVGGSKSRRSKFKPVSFDSISIGKTPENPNSNLYDREALERSRKAALDYIKKNGGKLDPRDLEVDKEAYLDHLSELMSNYAVEAYRDEINGYNNSNAITNWFYKYGYTSIDIKTKADVEKALKEAEKEKDLDIERDVEEPKRGFVKSIVDKITTGDNIVKSIMSASTESFVNVLYTADRAIYDMMYKTEIKDDEDSEQYTGFLDAMLGKMKNKFKDITEAIKKDIIEPFKERLGIDEDFTDRFKSSLTEIGKNTLTGFINANASVYGPSYHNMMEAIGIRKDKAAGYVKDRKNYNEIRKHIGSIKNAKNIYDESIVSLSKEYGIDYLDYGTVEDIRPILYRAVADNIYKKSKNLTNLTNISQEDIDFIMKYASGDKKFRDSYIKSNKLDVSNIPEADIASYIRSHASNRLRDDLKEKNTFGNRIRQYTGISGTYDEQRAKINEIFSKFNMDLSGVDLGNINSQRDINILLADAVRSGFDSEKDFLSTARGRTTTNAKGTFSRPFRGLTTLTKGEGLINGYGFNTVPKTGIYNVTEPTHIINTEDMYELSGRKGPRVSIEQALAKENSVAKAAGLSISSHATGTNAKIKNGNMLDAETYLSEVKKFLPELAAGGAVGGVLSLLLGIVGGPLVGAAVGAGASLVSKSDIFKDTLFGKADEDGNRNGGIISKSIMDNVKKYFPDMTKYGIAGIIPGLITPLGPIGGLMAGAAFGFLKNNERFTNKYFGESGALHIKTKEKEILQKLLPGAFKGAAAGAIGTFILGGPFGLLGNAALGAGIGMMTTTSDFQELILGKEVDGERVGGLVGVIKDALTPFTEILHQTGQKIIDTIDNHFINPIANFVPSAIHALPIFLGTIPRLISKVISNTERRIHRTIATHVTTLLRPLGNAAKAVFNPITTAGTKVLSIPGRVLNTAGNMLRSYDIQHLDTVDMTQREAVEWMDANGKGKKVNDVLRASSIIGSGEEGALSVEQAESVVNLLSRIDDTDAKATKNMKKANDKLNSVLTQYKTADGKTLSATQITKVLEAAKTKDYSKISDILTKYSLNGSRDGLTQAEFNEFMDGPLREAVEGAASAKTRLDNISNIDKDQASDELRKALDGKAYLDKFNLSDPKQRRDAIRLFKEQITHLKANDIVKTGTEELQQANSEALTNISRAATNIEKLLLAMLNGETNSIKAVEKDVANRLRGGQSHANDRYARRINKARRSARFNGNNPNDYTDATIDRLSTGHNNPLTKIDPRVLNIISSVGVENFNGGLIGFANKNMKVISNTELMNLFEDDAIKLYAESTKYAANRFSSRLLGNRNLVKIITTLGLKVNVESLQMLNNIDTPTYKSIITLVSKIIAKHGAGVLDGKWTTLSQMLSITLEERAQLRRQFNITDSDPTLSRMQDAMNTVGRATTRTGEGLIGAATVAPMIPHAIVPGVVAGATGLVGAAGLGIKKIGGLIRDRAHGIHGRGYYRARDTRDRITGRGEEQTPQEDNTIQGNALGTILGGGLRLLGKVGSGALGLVKSVGGAAVRGITSLTKGTESRATALANPALHNMTNAALEGSGTEDNNDKPSGNSVHVGDGNFIKTRTDNNGSVEPDTRDSDTKEVMNKLSLKETMQKKLADAQIKACEMITNTFDTSSIPESNRGKLNWFALLFGTSFLWKYGGGFVGKLFNSLIKPVWTDHIKPWFGGTFLPWVGGLWSGTIKPFLTDELPKKIATGLESAVTGLADMAETIAPIIGKMAGAIIGEAITNLPGLIKTSVDTLTQFTTTLLDHVTKNKFNAGEKTTVTLNDFDNYDDSYTTGYVDENGRRLTVGDLKAGNYTKIYNNMGVEVDTSTPGVFVSEDKSLKGASYLSTMGKAGFRTMAKSIATGKNSLITKGADVFATKMMRSNNKFHALMGLGARAITKPLSMAENLGIGINNKIGNLIDRSGTSLIEKGLIESASDIADAGVMTKTSKFVNKINDIFGFSPLKKVRSGIDSIVEAGKAGRVAEAAGDAVEKATENAKSGTFVAKIYDRCKAGIEALFGNEALLNKLKDIATTGKFKNVTAWINKLKDFILGILQEASDAAVIRLGTKACKKALTNFLNVFSIATDFIVGCDQAETLLGVEDTSVFEEVICGIVNVITNLFVVFAIVPGTGWFVEKILGFFEIDLSERKAEAQAEYERYKKETGSTLTLEEYLKRNKSFSGNIKKTAGLVLDKAKSAAGFVRDKVVSLGKGALGLGKSAFDWGKNTVSNLWDKGSAFASNVWDKGSAFASNVWDKASNAFDSVKNSAVGMYNYLTTTSPLEIIKNVANKPLELINTIIGNVTDGLSLTDTFDTIEKAKSGEISVFDKEYWKDKSDNENTVMGAFKKVFSKLSKVLAFPVLMIKQLTGNLFGWIMSVAGAITGDDKLSKEGESVANTSNKSYSPTSSSSSSKSSSSSSKSSKSSTSKKTGIFATISNIGSSVVKGVKSLFGLGKNGYYKQIDPSVAGIRFNTNGDSEYQTIGDSGCGPAAAVNAIESMYGRGNALLDAAKLAINGGYKEINGGTKPGFFTDYFNRNGFNSQTSFNRNQIRNNILNGMPTVLMGKDPNGASSSTPFAENPHYVTVTGMDSKGNAIVQDPESKYDNQLYPVDKLMSRTSLGISAFGKKRRRSKYGKGNYDAQIWWYLKRLGMTDAGAAGMMGNLEAESGLRPNNVEDLLEKRIGTNDVKYTNDVDRGVIDRDTFLHPRGGKTQYGYGLAQWTSPGRKGGLYDLAKSKRVSISDLGMQLEYLGQELNTTFKNNVMPTLRSSNNLAETSNVVLLKFERPANSGYSVQLARQNRGRKYFDKFKGTTGTPVSGVGVYNYDTSGSSYSTYSGTDYQEEVVNRGIIGELSSAFADSKMSQAMTALLGSSGSGKWGRAAMDESIGGTKKPTTTTKKKTTTTKKSAPYAVTTMDTIKKDLAKNNSKSSALKNATTLKKTTTSKKSSSSKNLYANQAEMAIFGNPLSGVTKSNIDSKMKDYVYNNPNSSMSKSYADSTGYDLSTSPYYGEEEATQKEEKSIIQLLLDAFNESKLGLAFNEFFGSTSTSSTSDGSSSSSSGIKENGIPGSTGSSLSNPVYGDAAAMVNIAKGEVGTKERTSNYVKYNDWYYGRKNAGGPSYPWCAAFVSWVANQAGIPTNIIPKTASTKDGYGKLVNNGGKIPRSVAKPGDIIYFTKNGSASGIYHTGIVTNNTHGKISTVEGNSSNMVAERAYSINDSKVLIARPKYTNSGRNAASVYTGGANNVAIGEVSSFSNTRGGNSNKPLSRYGQFTSSLYGTGAKYSHKSLDGYSVTEESNEDKKLGKLLREQERQAKSKYNNTYGKGTSVDYTNLINTIIKVLLTIADNTDKLNTIISILNNKLGVDITHTDISNANASNNMSNLKQKLMSVMKDMNTSTSKYNAYADNIGDSSVNSIISAMNAIAAE